MLTKALRQGLFKAMMSFSNRVPLLEGRVGHSIYPYMFTPRQLMLIATLAEKASTQTTGGGTFVEAGCAYGATTVFLNKLMNGFPKSHPFIALDTFSGFTAGDIAHEVNQRGKPAEISQHFVVNRKDWFDKTIASQGITRVRSVQTDISVFDFSSVAPICFCLLDVDLYLPIKNTLPNIVENLAPGGIVVVDDCAKNDVYDGAELAYREFCAQHDLPYTVMHGKLGIIEAPLP